MRTIARAALVAATALLASPAVLGEARAACKQEPAMRGMNERIAALRDHMDRIERTEDRGRQRDMMELQIKLMEDGMREIRRRDLGTECRIDMLASMMEVMIRHQHAMHDPKDRR